MLILDI